ncbi:hypothetical protein C8J57DRAFT_1477746 [Mycena rebaudengoi]|nr:hypothetical protein C8J57DRAFT_1477746 [Mycena rebaudengoi]
MRRARQTAHRHFKAHAGILIARATRRELCIDLGKIGYGWGLALEHEGEKISQHVYKCVNNYFDPITGTLKEARIVPRLFKPPWKVIH